MIIEISLVVIALALVVLVVGAIRVYLQTQHSVRLLHAELFRLVYHLNEFAKTDLPAMSEKSTQLMDNLASLCAHVPQSQSLVETLFKSFRFFKSDSSSDESVPKCEAIPQTMKWIASSMLLFKTIKEFVKHEKRTK